MAKSVTKSPKPTARESLLARARERFPDRKFADLGSEPSEDVADLDESIDEMLTDMIGRQSDYEQHSKRLKDLLRTDPSAAEFLQKWVETNDPRTALVETFGDDLGMTEEGKGKFKSQLDAWRERKAANDAIQQEAAKNWEESLQALEAWGDKKKLSFEDKRDVMVRLLAITFNGMENKYADDDFDLAYNALHHDKDVANARTEGEVAGRNEKIAAARRERATTTAMPPAPIGRQGGSVAEPKPKKKSFWGEVNNA